MRKTLREARKANHLTQAQLGKLVGLKPTAISALERGQNAGRVTTWEKLAKVLGVDEMTLRQTTEA